MATPKKRLESKPDNGTEKKYDQLSHKHLSDVFKNVREGKSCVDVAKVKSRFYGPKANTWFLIGFSAALHAHLWRFPGHE